MRTKALEGAFLATTYRVATDAGVFNLRIGVANAGFDDYLRRLGVSCWAVLTACNPRGVRNDDGNSQRQIKLLERIKLSAYRHFQATNLANDDAWPAESLDSFCFKRAQQWYALWRRNFPSWPLSAEIWDVLRAFSGCEV